MKLMFLCLAYAAMLTAKKVIYYADFEHPNVTYLNPKHFEFLSFKAQRYSRLDPIHYMNFHAKTLTIFGNDIVATHHLYEFLSNEYRPSMVIIRYRICDILTDPQFQALKPLYIKFYNASSCPFKTGEYNIQNISLSNVPLLKTFPLRQGRVFISLVRTGGERIAEGHIDIAIKERYI